MRQGGRELFRFQAGSIDYGTRTRLASFTKTVSAGVVLDVVEDGLLGLDERLGDAYPQLFEQQGLGDPTVLDCWAMRHGIETPAEFHRDPAYTHAQSVFLIGTQGFELFPAGERLGYDGAGMQVVGLLATQRTGLDWETLARTRLFDPLEMASSDYGQFAPNPAVAGGLRSSAIETMAYAQMVLDGGVYRGQRLLEPTSIEELFTNRTRGLPVEISPFPETHPDYPYGVDPDYTFGGWALAENPASQHVEELVGAGAWGSFIWIDRRRGLTAVLITDIPPGTQRSIDAALGLFRIAREAVESEQVQSLQARTSGTRVTLSWQPPAGALSVRLFGSDEPIQDRLRPAQRHPARHQLVGLERRPGLRLLRGHRGVPGAAQRGPRPGGQRGRPAVTGLESTRARAHRNTPAPALRVRDPHRSAPTPLWGTLRTRSRATSSGVERVVVGDLERNRRATGRGQHEVPTQVRPADGPIPGIAHMAVHLNLVPGVVQVEFRSREEPGLDPRCAGGAEARHEVGLPDAHTEEHQIVTADVDIEGPGLAPVDGLPGQGPAG